MINDLLLLSGNDIPFVGAQVNIHQPTLKEIAYIGEDAFFIGCGFLDFSKNILNNEDKVRLSNYDDFDIFMSIMINKKNKSTQRSIECAYLVLCLIFPLYEVSVRENLIVLKQDNKEYFITKKNFSEFREIIQSIFSLKIGDKEGQDYNPKGDMAARIAEKFKKRHEKLLKISNEKADKNQKKITILSRYTSILSVGTQKSFNELMNYTVYQLYNEFQRFQLKVQWDAYIQAKMAGVSDLEEVDNWMIDLQEQGKTKNKK